MKLCDILIDGGITSFNYMELVRGDCIYRCDIKNIKIHGTIPILLSNCVLEDCDIIFSDANESYILIKSCVICDTKIQNAIIENDYTISIHKKHRKTHKKEEK